MQIVTAEYGMKVTITKAELDAAPPQHLLDLWAVVWLRCDRCGATEKLVRAINRQCGWCLGLDQLCGKLVELPNQEELDAVVQAAYRLGGDAAVRVVVDEWAKGWRKDEA